MHDVEPTSLEKYPFGHALQLSAVASSLKNPAVHGWQIASLAVDPSMPLLAEALKYLKPVGQVEFVISKQSRLLRYFAAGQTHNKPFLVNPKGLTELGNAVLFSTMLLLQPKELHARTDACCGVTLEPAYTTMELLVPLWGFVIV